MKRESAKFGNYSEVYGYEDWGFNRPPSQNEEDYGGGGGTDAEEEIKVNNMNNRNEYNSSNNKYNIENEPSQLVISIKESVNELRNLLEEQKSRESRGNSPVPISPTFSIPLSFRFKSFLESSSSQSQSQSVRSSGRFGNRYSSNSSYRSTSTSTCSAPTTPVAVDHHNHTPLHQEQKMLSLKDAAVYCNGNGSINHNHTKNSLPSSREHEPEEVQRISALIKDYRENDSELERAKREVKKLEDQIQTLQESRVALEKEKASLVLPAPSSETQVYLSEASTSKQAKARDAETVTDGKVIAVRSKPKRAWRMVKKGTSRIFFGLLEAWF